MSHYTKQLLLKQQMACVLFFLAKQTLQKTRAGIAVADHHPHFLFQYYKNFQLKNRLGIVSPQGKALCLLKTQFAKKPKNPV